MDKIKAFFKGKRADYFLMMPALAFGVIALALYQATGITEFTPTLSGGVTAAYVVFIVLCAVCLVLDLRILKFAAYAAGLFAFLRYIVFQLNYIANLFVSIDPTELTAGFVLVLVFGPLAFVAALVSAIITKSGFSLGGKKEERA